jgi:hypothetical protein
MAPVAATTPPLQPQPVPATMAWPVGYNYSTVQQQQQTAMSRASGGSNVQVATVMPPSSAAVQDLEVLRYRTEKKTAYKIKSQSGRMRVSAPLGSNEAQLFDAIADAHSTRTAVPPEVSDVSFSFHVHLCSRW